jgi:hypothetical protein
MMDFGAAFNQGQRAADQAITNKAEIDEVLDRVSRDISNATDGRLKVFIAEITSPGAAFAALALSAQGVFSGSPTRRSFKEHWICASNPKAENQNERKLLAKWAVPYEGYPCTVTFNNHEVRCHDREGLEQALAEMLADAWVGERLRELLNLPLAMEMDETRGDEQSLSSDESSNQRAE